MTIEALITGKIHQRAEIRTGRNSGRHFVLAKLRASTGEAENCFVSVITFSTTVGDTLLALEEGDSVALTGTLKPSAWIDHEGQARPSLDLFATQVLTLYALKKRRAAVAAVGTQPEAEPDHRTAPQHGGIGPQDWPSEDAYGASATSNRGLHG